MEYINKVELQGIVGTINVSSNIICFSLVTSNIFKSNDSVIVDDTWHSVTVMKENLQGEINSKSWVKVTGRLKNSKYLDVNNIEHNYTKVIADCVKVLN